MWRLGHNSHPLHMNIQRRGVELDTRCNVCGGYFEVGGYLFFRCKYVKALWRAADLENERRALMQQPTSLEVLQGIFALEEGKKQKVICLMWKWWTERNSVRHCERQTGLDVFFAQLNLTISAWYKFFSPLANLTVTIFPKWTHSLYNPNRAASRPSPLLPRFASAGGDTGEARVVPGKVGAGGARRCSAGGWRP